MSRAPVNPSSWNRRRAKETDDRVAEFADRIVSTVAHELRTPLSVIVGYAELLRVRDDDDIRQEATTRILEGADRLSSVIHDILTVSTIDADSVSVDPAPVDLEAAVADVIRLFEVKTSTHTLTARAAGDAPPIVSADPHQLSEILARLVSNACESSPEGGEIVISSEARDGFAVVSVADEGRGMGEEERAAVFERFSHAVNASPRDSRGTGLGLYIASRFVELNGGSISVEGAPGRGSTFTFTVPLAEKDDRE